jgi:hypothetical protein
MPSSIVDAVLLSAVLFHGAFAMSKAPAGAIVLPLTYNEFTDAYYAPFDVGTPPQTEYLKVDTGSATISFLDSRSSFCNQSNHPCETYGSFGNETSSYVSTTVEPYQSEPLTKRDPVRVNTRALALQMNWKTLGLVFISRTPFHYKA